MKLRKLLRGAPSASEALPRRRRRAPRADGPRTIIPLDDGAPAPEQNSPFAVNADAARERLRRTIPPVADDAA